MPTGIVNFSEPRLLFYLNLGVGRRQFSGVRPRRGDMPQAVLGVKHLLRVMTARWRGRRRRQRIISGGGGSAFSHDSTKMSREILHTHNVKVVPIFETSVRFRSWIQSWSRSSAVSPQVTEAINPAVGCHYFPPGPRLPPQPTSITAHWPVPNYTAWWQRHVCVNNLPRVALGSAAAGIRTRDLLIASPVL